MAKSHRNSDSDARDCMTEALEAGVAEIKTAGQAARALDSLEKSAGNLSEEDAAQATPGAGLAVSKPARVIEAVAVQSATATPAQKPIVDEAVAQAMGAGRDTAPPPEVQRGRRLLRHELFRRLRPLQAADAFAFVQINQLPHPPLSDRLMSRLSWVMTGGTGWLLVLAVGVIMDRKRGWKAAITVAPALWLATATVEYPIKKWFRRRRPFVALVQAIIVGRKPGSYSFPSGQSAAAFAGATLLAKEYPAAGRCFFGLAALTAFSRIYLGAHYPGDVVSGSLLGTLLARFYSRLLRRIVAAKD